jgi:hypothetical protein
VIWYQAQFQARTYLERALHFDSVSADSIMIIAMLLGTPFIVLPTPNLTPVGVWHDGRMLGCVNPSTESGAVS